MNFELDKWTVHRLNQLYTRGDLDIRPPYQRQNVWGDKEKQTLIESIRMEYPMGILLLDEHQEPTARGNTRYRYDVVDGQQRCTTLFEYINGAGDWTRRRVRGLTFVRYNDLDADVQDLVDNYQVPVCILRGCSDEDIREIFVRIQLGRALVPAEKIRALNTPYRDVLTELAEHRLFELFGGTWKTRDSNWFLAGSAFMAVYRGNNFIRQEYLNTDAFLRDRTTYDASKSRRVCDSTKRLLNLMREILINADNEEPLFTKKLADRGTRFAKWTFTVTAVLHGTYTTTGAELGIARAMLSYWHKAIEEEGTDEEEQYLRTGRTGRVDTLPTRRCIDQLLTRVILEANLDPIDPQRDFNQAQREEIFSRSSGVCQFIRQDGNRCPNPISASYFHADHIRAHSRGGPTSVENGRALCRGCNLSIGNNADRLVTVSERDQ